MARPPRKRGAARAPTSVASSVAAVLARVDETADGGSPAAESVPSGFPSLDRVLGGGFRRGDLIVLGGDVGSGKSALALAMAVRAAGRGRRVPFFNGAP